MTKVVPVADVATFLLMLQKSGLIDADDWEKTQSAAQSATSPKNAALDLVKKGKLTRWQATQLLRGYRQLTIGQYKLLDKLGSGELGQVYLAEHGQLGRRVAIKVLSKRHTGNPEVLKRFLQEARRVGGLDHRNLAHVYDVNQEADVYYIVMEYVEGDDLQKLVDKAGQLDIPRTIEIARQAAEGLGHAHEQKVIHGDLKPSNLVIDKQGTVKILDVGLVELTEAPPTTSGEDSGESPSMISRIYRAKEQLEGKQVTQSSDWYSLGAVLCFLLTGKPFEYSEGCRATDELKEKRPDAPSELVALCASLLAENPVDRPTSHTEVIQSLDQARQSLPSAEQGEKPAAEPRAKAPPPRSKAEAPAKEAPKAKKPPVARAIEDGEGKSDRAAAEEVVVVAAADDFPSFSINTSAAPPPKKPAAQKPAPKTAAKGADAKPAASEKVAETDEASDTDAAAAVQPAKTKSMLPLIIGGAVGGGVLVILAIVGIVVALMWSGDEVTTVAKSDAVAATQAPADAAQTISAEETNPVIEADPVIAEADPVIPEANPMPAAPEAPPATPTAVPAAATATSTPAAEAKPAAAAPAAPMPPATPTAAPPAADKPAAAPADAKKDAAKTEPAKTDAKTPPAKAEPPKPAPPKPPPKPVSPFQGFAKAVTLPKLPDNKSEPTTDALAPVVLGPCNVDESALISMYLFGGEFAAKGGRDKFTLEAANSGTAPRDWEVRCGADPGSAPIIATLSAKDKQLKFQWTPEGAKHESAASLCNCVIQINAGSGSHELMLRETVPGEPLELELDKAPPPVRWTIETMPDPRQVEVEIVQFAAEVPKTKIDTSTISAAKGFTNVWAGHTEDQMILGFRVESSITGRGLELKASPQIKLEGMVKPERYLKKDVERVAGGAQQQLQGLAFQLQQADKLIKNAEQKKAAKAQISQQLEQAQKISSQMDQLQTLAAGIPGKAKIHARVWYLADTQFKVLLLDTGGPPPEAPKK